VYIFLFRNFAFFEGRREVNINLALFHYLLLNDTE